MDVGTSDANVASLALGGDDAVNCRMPINVWAERGRRGRRTGPISSAKTLRDIRERTVEPQ